MSEEEEIKRRKQILDDLDEKQRNKENDSIIESIIYSIEIAEERMETHSQDEINQACYDFYDDVYTVLESRRGLTSSATSTEDRNPETKRL